MRKTKKALASLAIAGMVLSIAPMSVFGATTTTTRLAGSDRVATAIAVASQGWTASDSVIVVPANDANIVDALAAAPLAGQLNAPILVTDKGTLDPTVQQKIVDLKAKNVYAVGALSADTVASLKAISGVTVTALQGADRTETAAKVAAQLTNIKGSFVVAYDGTADAMSAASYAAANGYSILVENPDGTLPTNEAAYTGAKQYTVGGQAKLAGATALAGADRYATNDAVVNALDYQYDTVYVANGETLVDALAGASLAAQTKSPIVLADTTHSAQAVTNKLTATSQVVALGGVGVVPENIRLQVGHSTTGTVSVQNVSAINASSFKVTFGAAPADTSKVVFAVQNGTAPVTVSATWNDAKTEATLTNSANFVSGTYSVNVINDATDLGTSSVAVTEQKVAKIEITSSKLGVTNVTTGVAPNTVTTQYGYATYRILDQYGVDVTSLAIGQNVQFQTGVGTIDPTKGLIKVTPSSGLNLLTFGGGVVITANDTTSGVSTTATLAATSQIGTLSDIQLTTLTNTDGKVLTAGDSTDVFYAGYTATDLSGNPTTNYTMMEQGLILTGDHMLTTSNPSNVTAQLVQDPADSTKALIKVVASSNATQVDMPLVITAMTWTGKTSQITTTLKKQAEVDTFTLYSPTEAIADGESKNIPFVAYDQNGVAITRYSDLFGGSTPLVTLTGAYPVLNNDGTASIKNTAVANSSTTSIPDVISAVTKTGKYSSITINIQKKVKADTLSLDNTVLNSNLQQGGATETADFGWNNGGFTVKDQYGRVIDMTTVANNGYSIHAYSDAPSIISAQIQNGAGTSIAGNLTTGQTQVAITSVGIGSTTVHFELYSGATLVDTKSQTFSSVANTDIKDYTMDQLTNPIYIMNGTAGDVGGVGSISDQELDYRARPHVYGTTASGAKVILAGANVVTGVNSTSSDFTIATGAKGAAYDGIRVIANKLADPAKTGSSATITATILGADGFAHIVKTPITSSTAQPVAASVDVDVETSVAGIARTDDTVRLTAIDDAGYKALLGSTLAKYDSTGKAGAQNIYFAPLDQYGRTSFNMAQYLIIATGTSTANGSVFRVDATNGSLGGSTFKTGDYLTVSGTTTSGLIKTIKIEFGAPSTAQQSAIAVAQQVVTNATTAKATADAAVVTATTAKTTADAAVVTATTAKATADAALAVTPDDTTLQDAATAAATALTNATATATAATTALTNATATATTAATALTNAQTALAALQA
jgi:putative cell wall-binding protein